jgi:hypothetical protein
MGVKNRICGTAISGCLFDKALKQSGFYDDIVINH